LNILLTGATGYIGQRLLPVLIDQGHTVYCCVRDRKRFDVSSYPPKKVQVIESDFEKPATLTSIPQQLDVAFYLLHSMASSKSDFADLEISVAGHFRTCLERTTVKQVIYLGGIVNETKLSKHLASRLRVEHELASDQYHLTRFRAGIIVGSGSASFEIIRDLVEKLPVMVTPKWLNTKCQPVAIRNVIQVLTGALLNEETYREPIDLGGPEILTYKQMLLQYAEVRHLKRFIFTVPVMTPRLSSYWLFFVTSTSFPLAQNLVDSMKVNVIAKPNTFMDRLGLKKIPYREAIHLAFDKVDQNQVISSWKDALNRHPFDHGLADYIEVPRFGCYRDSRKQKCTDRAQALDRVFSIGGKNGWYYGNWLWEIRGLLDQLVGGVGLRRGRKNQKDISPGESLDFWRVLVADKQKGRLLLFAEMKLPGDAWLEFRLENEVLIQTATFRPLGLLGRLYWYAVMPFHGFVFSGMLNRIVQPKTDGKNH
jgi:uncharacterized protein YbjT (DUF2867 family)